MSLQGGKLTFAVDTPCNAITNTIYEPTVHTYFQNEEGQGQGIKKDTIIVKNADVVITKSADRADPVPGDTVTYTLNIANQGSHEASNITLTDTLPIGTCYVPGSSAALSDGWSIGEPTITSNTATCGPTTQQSISWSVASGNAITHATNGWNAYLPANSETVLVTYQITITNGAQAGDNIINDVVIDTTNPEEDNANNTGQSQTTVPYPDLLVTTAGDETVQPGE